MFSSIGNISIFVLVCLLAYGVYQSLRSKYFQGKYDKLNREYDLAAKAYRYKHLCYLGEGEISERLHREIWSCRGCALEVPFDFFNNIEVQDFKKVNRIVISEVYRKDTGMDPQDRPNLFVWCHFPEEREMLIKEFGSLIVHNNPFDKRDGPGISPELRKKMGDAHRRMMEC